MNKCLHIFVEGMTDKIFIENLINSLFENAKKKKLKKHELCVYSLDGICKAESIILDVLDNIKNKNENTICLIYDTDAFEYSKKPPISVNRIQRLVNENGFSQFISIPIVHNIEDIIIFSKKEILFFLDLPKDYTIPKNLTGLEALKKMYKQAGKFYIKGNKAEDLFKELDYISIAGKFCHTFEKLCSYFDFNCSKNLCKIKKK